jgi:hypothetical protein
MSMPLDDWAVDLAARTAPRFRAALEALVEGQPDAEVVGLGISTDADATAVVAAANTRRNLDSRIEQTPAYPRYCRWSTGEWDLLSIDVRPGGADGLGPVHDEVERFADAAEDGELEEATSADVRTAAWRAMSMALAMLRRDGFFDRWPNAVVVLEAVDAAVTDDQRRAWIRAIDTAEHADEHEQWLEEPSS